MTQTQPKKQLWPQLMMVAATVIWGSSFLIMKQAVDGIPVFFLLAVRFTLGAGLLAVVFWKRWRKLDRATLRGGCVLGVLMELAYIFQTYGLNGLGSLQGTTPGKNAFFTGIYCVLVPFFAWLLFHKRPDLYNVAAALFCIAGIGLVSLGGEIGIVGGDVLTMLGGVMFALHILAVPRYAEKSDVVLLTILQFATMAATSWVGVLCTGQAMPLAAIPMGAWLRIGYLAVFATALALLFQNIGQAHTPPATAAVLLSLEAPFGVLFSVLFGTERPTPAMYCGFALIFFAIIVSETKLSFLPRKKFLQKGVDK